MAKNNAITDPFKEWGDIGKNDVVKPQNSNVGFPQGFVAENEKESENATGKIRPSNPYKESIITKNASSLGRSNHGYSLSTELFLRIKMLAANRTHEYLLAGKKRKCTESELIEEGMRYVLKKNRYKYKDLEEKESES